MNHFHANSRDIRKSPEWNAASINQKMQSYQNHALVMDAVKVALILGVGLLSAAAYVNTF